MFTAVNLDPMRHGLRKFTAVNYGRRPPERTILESAGEVKKGWFEGDGK